MPWSEGCGGPWSQARRPCPPRTAQGRLHLGAGGDVNRVLTLRAGGAQSQLTLRGAPYPNNLPACQATTELNHVPGKPKTPSSVENMEHSSEHGQIRQLPGVWGAQVTCIPTV